MTLHESDGARLTRQGASIDPSSLVAHTAPVDPARVATFTEYARRTGRIVERDGFALLSIGECARVELPAGLAPKRAATDATRLLGAITHNGTPALAIGTIAFDATRPAIFVLPSVTVIVRDGAPPLGLVIAPPSQCAEILDHFPFTETGTPLLDRELPPDAFELTSVRSHADFRDRVAAAVEAIARGEIDKVVLAREITVRANRPYAPGEMIRRLRQLHPGCATFSVDGFVGASPELLVRRDGQNALSRPLAGTVARSGDPDEDAHLAAALLGSAKERREHAYVVNAIVDAFGELGAVTEHSEVPELLELRNVVHLASTIRAILPEPTSVLELVAILHPTPAVGGYPRDAALAYLERFEAFDRDRYAGEVGWFDGDGDGEFYIGIRSAMIDGPVARLIAGCGIVEGSDPDAELAESQIKLQALLAAAVRP